MFHVISVLDYYYDSFTSLFLYKFILINIDINTIKAFIIIVSSGIPKLLTTFIILSIILGLLLISDTIDTGTVFTSITIIVINILPLFMPNFKTKGITIDIDNSADVILVGINISSCIIFDEFILVDIKYTIHISIVDNNILTTPNKYLDKTYSFLFTGRYAIK